MLKTSKKILSTIMVVIMVLTAVPLSGFVGLELPALDWGIRASALASSGWCGPNVTYTYDSVTKELVISGIGAMTDYNNSSNSPFYHSDIKSIVIENGVTSVGERTFCECYNVTSITIPDSVTSIGYAAFWGCNCLDDITLPDSLNFLDYGVFYNTGYYNNSSNWVDGVLYIGKHLIEANTSLSGDYAIKSGTLTISSCAFQACYNLTGVTIPDSAISIGNNVFDGCTSLEKLTIGKGVKEIPEYAFQNLTALKTVTLSEGLEKINDYAFSDCTYLETINIPDSVTYIGTDILKNTAWFNYRGKGLIVYDDWIYGYKGDIPQNYVVVIDKNIKGVASCSFVNNSNVVAFDVAYDNNNLSSLDGVLFNKDKTVLMQHPKGKYGSDYIIPDTVEEIYPYAFYDCYISNITIGENLKKIGLGAFYYYSSYFNRNVYIKDLEQWCKLDIIAEHSSPLYTYHSSYSANLYVNGIKLSIFEIPNTISEIKQFTFAYFNNLISIEMPSNVTSINRYAFYSCRNLTNITLSKNLKSIAEYAFSSCSNLKDIYYPGSQEDWNAIIKGYNYELTNADLYLMHKHDYTVTVTTQPTCTETGLALYECAYGDTKTEILPALGHNEVIYQTEVEATCTKDGYTEGVKCSVCGIIIKESKVISALPHTADWTITKEATCTNEGEKTGYCTVCGTDVVEIIPKTTHPDADCNKVCDVCFETITGTGILCNFIGHQMSWVKVQQPTCTSYGREIYVCTRADCGYISSSSSLPRLSHTKITYQSAVAPTCTEPGSTEGVECSVCHMVISEVMDVPALGHKADWTITKEATCKEKGEREGYCTVCQTSVVETVARLSHTDTDGDKICDVCSENMPKINALCSIIGHSIEWVVTKSATCVSEGEEEYKCTRTGCEYKEYEYRTIPVLSHEVVIVSATAPTCSKEGNTEGSYCAMCGSIIETWELIDEIDHEPIESWYIEATCTEGGKTVFTCRYCGMYLYEEMTSPAHGHDFVFFAEEVSPTCLADGVATYMCSYDCGEFYNEPIPATGHTYSEWVELLPATCSERGLNIIICNDCNDIQRQIIPKLAHEDENNDGICDECGFGESGKPDTPLEPEVHEHSYTTTITKVPSCTENGIVNYACICGEAYNYSIAAYGHSDTDGNGLCDVCGYGEEVKPDIPQDPSENCSCNCHKSGLFNMLFKLILFFQKFLRMNKTCACGVSHY